MQRRIIPALVLLWLSVLCGGLRAAALPDQDLVFSVLLDDEQIGYHRFNVTHRQQQRVVDIEAKFKVTFLGIPVYRYQHRNRETWQQGCLASIVSSTVDGGDDFHVEGEDIGKQFELSTQDGDAEIDAGCVMTFAYWDREFLRQSKLLNAQNGEYLPVEVSAEGVEDLRVNGNTISASRHRLVNSDRDIDITVWHAVEDGRWLSLESRVGGRVIRYRLADGEQADALLAQMRSSAADTASPADRDSGQ